MSEPYTPTTNEVRTKFADWYSIDDYRDIAEGWFDSWLDRERDAARREGQTEAWADAIGEAYDRGWMHDYGRDEMIDRNPFESGEDHHVDQ